MRTRGAQAGDRIRICWFRALVYGGAVLHFVPSFSNFADNYSHDAFKTVAWSRAVHDAFSYFPIWMTWLVAGGSLGASILACLGVRARLAAIVSAAGLFCMASVNSLHTQTLALSTLWALLFLQAVLGAAHDVRLGCPEAPRAPETVVLTQLAPAYVLGTVFFSGVHKLMAGWSLSQSISRLSNYPQEGMLRPWMVGSGQHLSPGVGTALELATLACELLVPVLVLYPRTRRVATFVYVAFFVAIAGTLAVPPLFVILYLGAALLFRVQSVPAFVVDMSWKVLSSRLFQPVPRTFELQI